MERLVNVSRDIRARHRAGGVPAWTKVPEVSVWNFLMLVRVFVQNQKRFVLMLGRGLPHQQDVRVLAGENAR